MFDIQLRQLKDWIFQPLVAFVPDIISPNQITLLAFIAGLRACSAAALPQDSHHAVYFWLLNRFLDNLDGVLARSRNQASDLGGFLDLLSDFIVYSLIPISVACGQYAKHGPEWFDLSSFLAVTILEATFHVNNFVLFYVAALSATKQKGELTSLTMKPALIEGFESGLIFTIMFILPEYVVELSWAMAASVVLGTSQRSLALIRVLHATESTKSEAK
jgi:phosphatidylglycerophosphate synthase